MFAPIVIAAGYHQLHLFDDGACPPYPENITDNDLTRRLKTTSCMLSIYTASETDVVLRVEVTDGPTTPVQESEWLHIADASLSLPSGRLVVASPESHLPDCVRLTVLPGSYQARVTGRGFDAGATEEYLVSLWPGPEKAVSVIKWADPDADCRR